MRILYYTAGSPFARAVRIVLHELGIAYDSREEPATTPPERQATLSPTLQVPVFRDEHVTLWESELIIDYVLSNCSTPSHQNPPLAKQLFRPRKEWEDKLVLATIQTFGTAATMISQMTWTGVGVGQNPHLARSAEKLPRILGWLESKLPDSESGFLPGHVSIQDIFLAAHVRFVQARPLKLDLRLDEFSRISSLLDRLDERPSFEANPIWWWEPGIVGYQSDGTPIIDR